MNTFDINYLDNYPVIGYDTETTGLVYPKDRAFAVAIGLPDNNTYALDLRGDQEEVTKFRKALANYKGRIVCHNASFDYRMSVNAGVKMDIHGLDDTAIRACCYDENLLAYDLDSLCLMYLGEQKEDIYGELSKIFGGLPTRNVQMRNIHKAPWEIVGKYIRKDALLTLKLWMWQEENANEGSNGKIPSLHKIWDFERSLMPKFIQMEMRGIRVDLEEAHKAMDKVDEIVRANQLGINNLAGGEVNANSSKQVIDLLKPYKVDGAWYVDKVEIPSTAKGAPSLGAATLRSIDNQASNLILNIRSGIKTRDTFLGGHVIGHAVNGRVYPTINQSKGEEGGTRTGRLSYQNPAMQQIPSRNKEVAQTVKPVFLPEEGETWLDVDENSFEVRVFAHLVSKWDERIIDVYKKDPYTDFHQWVAELTGLVRNATYGGQPNAKQLNLSAIFNSGDGSIAAQMGMPWEWDAFEAQDYDGEIRTIRYKKPGIEAANIIATYHKELPGVKILQKLCKQTAASRGFIYTKRGRRIHFPHKRFTYKASGLLIQATAADFNKENIGIIDDFCKNNGGSLLLNTHDSYSLSIPCTASDEVLDYWNELRKPLEDLGRASIPLVMDVSGSGNNWWNALTNRKSENMFPKEKFKPIEAYVRR